MSDYPLERRIAIVDDYDKTLTEQYMQIPFLEAHFDNIVEHHDEKWKRPDESVIRIRKPEDWFQIVDAWGVPNNGISYLSQFLVDIKDGVFPNITNDILKEFGSQVKLAPGLPEFYGALKEKWKNECEISNFILSVGFKAMIEGSAVASHVDGIYGTEFVSLAHKADVARGIDPPREPVLDAIKCAVTPFSKSQHMIEIAKGGPENVDKLMSHSEYAFDYRNMITRGDSGTDISQFAIMRKRGAKTLCLYKLGDVDAFNKIMGNPLVRDRAHALHQRDYTVGSRHWGSINGIIAQMLNRKCDYDPVILDIYRKHKLRDTEIDAIVGKHIENCPECSGLYQFDWERPSPAYQVKQIWVTNEELHKVA